MSIPLHRAAWAVAAVLAARLSDWTIGELFMRRSPAAEVAAALLINAALLVLLYHLARRWLPGRAVDITLRVIACAGFAGLVLWGMRASILSNWLQQPALRWAAMAGVLVLVLGLVPRLHDEVAARLMRAVILGSLAFVAVPLLWRAATVDTVAWPGQAGPVAAATSTAPAMPAATMFLLLDETSASAAGPLADALRLPGLTVVQAGIKPTGENTMNVLPAMFSGRDFDNARACGRSTLCSGGNVLDFSRIRVQAPQVHMTGILFPYCDIQGLKSCLQAPLPHEHGGAMQSLATLYLRAMRLRLPDWLNQAPDHSGLKRRLLAAQTDFIDDSSFWTEGGLMYAHLPLPHPPGLDRQTDLDADYAANLQRATQLLAGWAARLHAAFPGRATIVVTSDHPLRQYWCVEKVYAAPQCKIRPSFESDQVPWIVASSTNLAWPTPLNNRVAFKALADIHRDTAR